MWRQHTCHSLNRQPVVIPSADSPLFPRQQTAYSYYFLNRLPVITPPTDCLLSLPQQTACYHSHNRQPVITPSIDTCYYSLKSSTSCKRRPLVRKRQEVVNLNNPVFVQWKSRDVPVECKNHLRLKQLTNSMRPKYGTVSMNGLKFTPRCADYATSWC